MSQDDVTNQIQVEAEVVEMPQSSTDQSTDGEAVNVDIFGTAHTLSEVAEFLNIKESKLRYWEQNFAEFLDNHRNQYNHRVFTKPDIVILEQIKNLFESGLYTTDGIKYVLRGELGGAQPMASQGGEVASSNNLAVFEAKIGELKTEINDQVREEFVKALNNLAGEMQSMRHEMREDLVTNIKHEMDHMTQLLMPPKPTKKWWQIF
jgi:DNA-binding transcriptional MerR regulator